MTAEQLRFDLPQRRALGRDDFFVSPANALALAQVDLWPDWPSAKLIVAGPPQSGKTHLAHVWAARSGGTIIAATALATADIPALAEGPVCVEDAHRVAGVGALQTALFHLHNLVLAQGHSLLLTATGAPGRWGLTLPDLLSRMQGTQVAGLSEPDDALLRAVLMKHFADRQIAPAPEIVDYLLRRMPRSFAAAAQVVDALDRAALARPKGVTRPLAAEVLRQLFEEQQE